MALAQVSVLTPCLNYARFLPDALESVARQSGLLEHVVQDGGSHDETRDILAASSAVWESEEDQGQSDALNRAFSRSKGAWIGWLNADEFYLPNALETLLDAADSSGADVVYGDMVEVNEVGRMRRLRPQHPYLEFAMRNFGPHIASCAMIVRRESLPALPWDTRSKVAMDWDLYLTLGERGARFEHIPYPVAAFRRHGAQVTARKDAWRADREIIHDKHGVRRSPGPTALGLIAHRIRKFSTGAYVRQLRARSLRGEDLRWFRDETGPAGCSRLLAACYRVGS